jgi:hypothetical protein
MMKKQNKERRMERKSGKEERIKNGIGLLSKRVH